MNFLEKLDLMMETSSLNKHKLSILSGVPYTTIDGFYKKGYENAKISTIKKIAQALGCSLDYLIDDIPTEIKNAPSPRRVELMEYFDQLNNNGQEKVIDYAKDLAEGGNYSKNSAHKLA